MPRIEGQDRFALLEDQLKSLFLRGLAGDSQAYKVFLNRMTAHLRAYVKRRLSVYPDEVEDVVQEALLAIHNQRHTYAEERPVTAWVQAIARYKLIDFLRRQSTHDGLHEPFDETSDLFLATDSNARETQRDLDQLLETLPDKQRLPIMYVKVEGLSVAEAALRTGLSMSAVKIGIHRGLKALALKIRGHS